MPMTPEAKSALSGTIRRLRTRLLDDLHGSTEAVYRLAVRARDSGLAEAARARRARLETWLDEQVRGEADRGRHGRDRDQFRREAEKRAAYTLLNRLVLLRLMEGMGLRPVPVLTGAWESAGYRQFREIAPALVRGDESEGYAFLLQLVFDELALDLPGLYGSVDVADLIPVGAATLRHAVEALDAPELATCWTDDMTLGWVYQYWNDPEREALDAKLHAGGKVEPHEIASKTQMFTERYMVDWLLQNSLGPMWLALCRKHGWTAECERPLPGEPNSPAIPRSLDEAKRNPGATTPGAPDSAIAPSGLQDQAGTVEGGQIATAGPPTDAINTTPVLTGLLRTLDERRADWRGKRERGEVSLTDLMPLHTEAEHRWAYYVPQPIPADAIDKAPDSVRDLKILDPAVGSGHFLVVAFELLFALYLEEARHRGESDQERWSDRAIVERILTHNLHGIDLDPRAVQIAAAALWLKARRTCPDARPTRLNLVASNLRLAGLPDTDPALVELRLELERETGIPARLTDTLIHALAGADHLGSLLKIDAAVEDAIARHEAEASRQPPAQLQLSLEPGAQAEPQATPVGAAPRRDFPAGRAPDRDRAKADILDRLETFLAHHTRGEDLGLRLHGEQLAAGVRFLRMLKEGSYHLVVGNPPYQGTSKMANADYVKRHYPLGKADLYAAFLIRGLQLAREGGTSALLTMRNWMFIKQYADLRVWLLERFDLRALGDFDRGAFEEVLDEVVSVVVSIFRNAAPTLEPSTALQPTPLDDRSRDSERTRRKRGGVVSQVGKFQFTPWAFSIIQEWPLVYWWSGNEVCRYFRSDKLYEVAPIKMGLSTSDNPRFIRFSWEVSRGQISKDHSGSYSYEIENWRPLVSGAAGVSWITGLELLLDWGKSGLRLLTAPGVVFRNPHDYMKGGIAFTPMGHAFSARAHRFRSYFDAVGRSVISDDIAGLLACMNSASAKKCMADFNPSITFTIGDVERIPIILPLYSGKICSVLENAFTIHEARREPSVEFKNPGPSPWRYAQAWAQTAVDRPEGAPLPPYEPEYDPEPPTDHLSFALGVALGRFGAKGEGILDPAAADRSPSPSNGEGALDLATGTPPTALAAGILFLDGTLDANERHDGLGDPAAEPLHVAWAEHGAAIDPKSDLRTWLRLKFFKDVHRGMYENRPIHWPLSSQRRTFVAWVNIHRWDAQTLRVLLADHLHPATTRIEGELADLRNAREGADRRALEAAEKRYDRVLRARDELADFMAAVEQCAERGPPPADPKSQPRECDARYVQDLDDGVMINSAALWPLLEPQWKDPQKWWKELSEAQGKKDYDWSHLAMRYWPTRVDAKCRQDPSLGVAHGCFWAYHPARAWAWELRLQDEIAPDFRIEEGPYRGDGGDKLHRAAYLADHPEEALAAIAKEALRRRRKQKAPQPELRILEPGLWTRHRADCWQLELDLIAKQGADFHLRAPDEPEARAAFEQAHPHRVAEREALLSTLREDGDLLRRIESADEPDDDQDEPAATGSDDESDEQPEDL